ncbi:MAG: SPOR domain-containing protein, partial [Bacteroidetes bacterium]|nr:SPOR domain-containing protein [Bacteroidota bacterium]
DPPSYKLRVGNFLNRADAEVYAQTFAAQGFPDAWVVPERVIKNIQPRPIPQQQDLQR